MIAKAVQMRSIAKSSFAGLVAYITDDQDLDERLGAINVTNFMSDANDLTAVKAEALAVQARNSAASDKTYHLIVSFRQEDNPSMKEIAAIEDELCNALGFEGHQRVSALHRDTDNPHLHIAINKVNPTSLTINNPYYDYATLAKTCEKLELKYGLSRDNHTPSKKVSQNVVSDMEKRTGMLSLASYLQKNVLPTMQSGSVKSWAQLHDLCASNGVELVKKGNGLVFKSLDGIAVKASTVGRSISKGNLEKSLGAFEPMSFKQKTDMEFGYKSYKNMYEPTPLNFGEHVDELFAEYKEDLADFTQLTGSWRASVDAATRAELDAIWNGVDFEKLMLKHAKMPRTLKKMLYKSIHQRKINKSLTVKSKQIYSSMQNIPRRTENYAPQKGYFTDWLVNQAELGNQKAVAALRTQSAAKANRRLPFNAISAVDKHDKQSIDAVSINENDKLGIDHVTRQGTIIWTGKDAAVIRDNGKLLRLDNANEASIVKGLSLAMQNLGNKIQLFGDDDFKKRVVATAAKFDMRVTFTDADLERIRKASLQKAPLVADKQLFKREQLNIANSFIADKERQRAAGENIKQHSLFKPVAHSVEYVGMRNFNGQNLILLQSGNKILVYPTDNLDDVAMLRSIKIGSRLNVLPSGRIKPIARTQRM